MVAELSFLFTGILLGITAGLTPGPLFSLTIAETLKYDLKEGIKIAVAPLFTDIPVILASFFVASFLSKISLFLGLISVIGAFVIAYYGYTTLSIKNIKVDLKDAKPNSFRKGIITNYLNPHLYVFQFTVSGPMMVKALKVSFISPFLYIIGFMATLVLSKILIASIAHKSKNFMNRKSYIYTVRIMGMVLILFALILLKDGLKYFKVI